MRWAVNSSKVFFKTPTSCIICNRCCKRNYDLIGDPYSYFVDKLLCSLFSDYFWTVIFTFGCNSTLPFYYCVKKMWLYSIYNLYHIFFRNLINITISSMIRTATRSFQLNHILLIIKIRSTNIYTRTGTANLSQTEKMSW